MSEANSIENVEARNENMKNKYQIFQYNTKTKEKVIGYASINTQLEGDEYISLGYEEDDDKVSEQTVTLISNVGTVEYECKGNCYCEEDLSSNRRLGTNAATSTIRKSLTYFVVAISALLATEKARNHFDSKCVEYMSDTCHESSIVSEFEDCAPLRFELTGEDGALSKAKKWMGYDDDSPFKSPPWKFFCTGNCIQNPEIFTNKKIKSWLADAEKYDCPSRQGNSQVEVPSLGAGDDPFSPTLIREAKKKFIRVLEKWCLKQPRWWTWTNLKLQVKYGDFNNSVDPEFCVGADKNGKNRSVECEFIGQSSG